MATGKVQNTLKLDALPAAMTKQVKATLFIMSEYLAGAVQTEMNRQGGVFTGAMIGGVKPAPVEFQSGVFRASVGTPYEHAAYYEWGTKPHMPPLEPIRRWVELKLQPHVISVGIDFKEGRALPTGKNKVLRGDKRTRAVMQLARIIQRSIAKHGTAPHAPMARAMDKIGMKYILTTVNGQMGYQIDLGAWIQKAEPDLWNKIAAGVAS